MSQTVTVQAQSVLIHDVYFGKRRHVRTSASVASCHVCNRGLEDADTLSARIVGDETVLLCEAHLD